MVLVQNLGHFNFHCDSCQTAECVQNSLLSPEYDKGSPAMKLSTTFYKVGRVYYRY